MSKRVAYFNSLVRDMTRETFMPGTVIDAEKRNQVLKKTEEYLSQTPPLFREFMTARTNGQIKVPEKIEAPKKRE